MTHHRRNDTIPPIMPLNTHGDAMKRETLKSIRRWTPGVVSVVFFSILVWIISGEWVPVEAEWSKLIKTTPVIAISILYYFLPFRDISNKKYYATVAENLRSKLVKISGVQDDKKILDWTCVSGAFYHFVEKDPSLKIKSELAYDNGAYWTAVADIRAISIVFILFSMILHYFGFNNSLPAVLVFTCIFIASFWFSMFVTKRHIEIGNEQLEIIELKYSSELKEMLEKKIARHNK